MALQEFSPEINENFYNMLAARIKARGEEAAGRAGSEQRARGFDSGDPNMISGVGMARAQTSGELSDLDANLAYQRAGLGRQERLIGEERQYQDKNSAQNFLNQRELAQMTGKMQYDAQGAQNAADYRKSYQSALWQLPGIVLGAGIGGLAGGGIAGGSGVIGKSRGGNRGYIDNATGEYHADTGA